MQRFRPYLIAFAITVVVHAVPLLILSRGISPPRDSVMIDSRDHADEIKQAISSVHLLNLRISTPADLPHPGFLLALFFSAQSVAVTLIVFLIALRVVKGAPLVPGKI
jgi:hypothetical protein